MLTSFWDFYVTMQDIRRLSEANSWEMLNDERNFLHRNHSKRGISLFASVKVSLKYMQRNYVQVG